MVANDNTVAKEKQVYGFTVDGWKVPSWWEIPMADPKHMPTDADVQRHAITMRNSITITTTKQGARYDCRDVLIAFNTASVFVGALIVAKKIKLDHMLVIGLQSDLGMTGRTSILRALTSTWWDYPENVNITDHVVNLASASRAVDFLARATFPVVINDLDHVNPAVIDALKPMLKPTLFTIKSPGSKPSRTIGISSPVYTSFNNEGHDLNDLVIHVNTRVGKAEMEKFKKIDAIPRGIIGWYIYQKTAGWTVDDVYKRYAAVRSCYHPVLKDETANTLYKLIRLGEALFEEIFGVWLNVEHCDELIEDAMARRT